MKLGILFSGGKDSTLALLKARKQHEIACLISVVSRNPDSYMFHVPNIHLTQLQSEALSIPLLTQETKGVKELELADLRKAFIKAKTDYGIEGIVTGAIRSVYQASRVQRLCDELGLWCFNPLWLIDQLELLNETLLNGFKTIISGVAGYPFTKDFLGQIIDEGIISKLKSFQEKFLINPAGEGGELETTVLDCPLFSKQIEILDSDTSFDNYAGVFNVNKARLVSK
ncbi:MAG: diphthine--ammonia ligase [Candidatus Nanoarchaeia archaeon]|jgi:ABC transporter with metal-binding/Fe-S-binding domain ATP-binding protein